MNNKKIVYFVGNAHLDPIWQWGWQEGSAEAKATIRSAIDRIKEYPDFKFVCSSASVYKWIEDFDRKMFEEIKQRVKEGRFIVVGGWFVQPDCNIPSGEGFARQSLYSQRYFKEKLGVTATTGYNVDSFGHNYMLPQILKKSGMNNYVFMRPSTQEKTLEKDIFYWSSPDGSEVLTYRIPTTYCLNFNDIQSLEKHINEDCERKKKYTDEGYMVFYGVGNHGGGPTKTNINIIKEYADKHPERDIVFSNIDDYFNMIRESSEHIAVHTDDLQHHASGCYSAVSKVKNDVRVAETRLLAAETYNVMAEKLCGKSPATKKLADAWENVLFCHFHDVMGGCAVKSSYHDVYNMLGEAQIVAAKTENSALQTISWAIDTKTCDKGYPIIIFNPHPFTVEKTVNVNVQIDKLTDSEGNEVTIQHVGSHWCWQKYNTVFTAKVPAMGYSTYYITASEKTEQPISFYIGKLQKDFKNPIKVYNNGFENDRIKVEFDEETGFISSFFDKEKKTEFLSGYGAVPIVIDETEHDTWSHGKNFFDKKIGVFKNPKMTVIEKGPVRAIIKVESYYDTSKLTQYFTLDEGKNSIDVKASIDWHEKHKMLKLAFETSIINAKAYYEIPFGVIERPADGEEECGQMWIMAKGDNFGCTIINNNKYSFSVKDNVMNMTVIRSPIYADHGGARTEESEYTDQGLSEFEYSFKGVSKNESYGQIIKEAKLFNTPLVYIIENKHEGVLSDNFKGIECNKENIMISAIKFSEDGKGKVVRIYETDGKDTEFTVYGKLLPFPLKSKAGKYSVNTYYCENGSAQWKEVFLTEYDFE